MQYLNTLSSAAEAIGKNLSSTKPGLADENAAPQPVEHSGEAAEEVAKVAPMDDEEESQLVGALKAFTIDVSARVTALSESIEA